MKRLTLFLGAMALGLFAGVALQPVLASVPARLAAFGLAERTDLRDQRRRGLAKELRRFVRGVPRL